MTQADSVHSTPPTNTSPTRRNILGTIAAAAASLPLAAAIATAAPAMPPAAAPIPLGPHPDAELFETVELYLLALSEYANSALAFGDVEFIKPRPRGYVSKKRAYHRTMNHFGRMEAELVVIRAKTLDGLLAKARAIEADRDVSDDLKESILDDLIGMAAEIGKAVA